MPHRDNFVSAVCLPLQFAFADAKCILKNFTSHASYIVSAVSLVKPPTTKLGGVYWNRPVRPSVDGAVR